MDLFAWFHIGALIPWIMLWISGSIFSKYLSDLQYWRISSWKSKTLFFCSSYHFRKSFLASGFILSGVEYWTSGSCCSFCLWLLVTFISIDSISSYSHQSTKHWLQLVSFTFDPDLHMTLNWVVDIEKKLTIIYLWLLVTFICINKNVHTYKQ